MDVASGGERSPSDAFSVSARIASHSERKPMPVQLLTNRYSRLSIALHWSMLALIALAYLFIELRELFERGTPQRELMRAVHASLGLTVLALVIVRLVARRRGAAPADAGTVVRWQGLTARSVHALLYVLMIGMPLTGWLVLSLRGDPVPFFGLELPALVAEDEALGKWLRGWHGDIGRAGYVLIGMHAGAALLHHWFWRDDTLLRMLPGR
jgi:cytochrome b561